MVEMLMMATADLWPSILEALKGEAKMEILYFSFLERAAGGSVSQSGRQHASTQPGMSSPKTTAEAPCYSVVRSGDPKPYLAMDPSLAWACGTATPSSCQSF